MRCPYCGKRVFNGRLVITCMVLAVVIVTVVFLFLDYYNIEVFR